MLPLTLFAAAGAPAAFQGAWNYPLLMPDDLHSMHGTQVKPQ